MDCIMKRLHQLTFLKMFFFWDCVKKSDLIFIASNCRFLGASITNPVKTISCEKT